MALAERIIDEQREAATEAEPQTSATTAPRREPLPSLFRAIELCLPFPYRRMQTDEHGWHWIWRSESAEMSARIYPNVEKDSITVAVFDDQAVRRTPARIGNNGAAGANQQTSQGVPIKDWSTDLRMTGNWRRRLRRSSGETLVLAQRRPKCPRCHDPLILRERNDGSSQFFGCRKFPECYGSTGIADHDLDRKKAGINQKRGGQYVPSPAKETREQSST